MLFTWLIYSITNSASCSAIIFGINHATSVIAQPFIGPLVEKLNKKKVLIVTDFTRTVLVFLIVITFYFNKISPWLLIVETISISLIEAFHMPSDVALFQNILDDSHYDQGISRNVSYTKIAVLIGTAFAGITIRYLGLGFSLILDGSIFLISTLLIRKINSAVVPFDALLAPIAAEMFNGNTNIISLLSVSITLGTIAGALFYTKLSWY